MENDFSISNKSKLRPDEKTTPIYTQLCSYIYISSFIFLQTYGIFIPKKYQKKKSETDAYSTHKLSDDLKKLTPSEKDPNMHTDWTCFIYQRWTVHSAELFTNWTGWTLAFEHIGILRWSIVAIKDEQNCNMENPKNNPKAPPIEPMNEDRLMV